MAPNALRDQYSVDSRPVQVIDKGQSRHSKVTRMNARITHDGFVSVL